MPIEQTGPGNVPDLTAEELMALDRGHLHHPPTPQPPSPTDDEAHDKRIHGLDKDELTEAEAAHRDATSAPQPGSAV
jgi:hypothetical protein